RWTWVSGRGTAGAWSAGGPPPGRAGAEGENHKARPVARATAPADRDIRKAFRMIGFLSIQNGVVGVGHCPSRRLAETELPRATAVRARTMSGPGHRAGQGKEWARCLAGSQFR